MDINAQQRINDQITEHRYEIDTLKETVNKVLVSLDNNTTAQQAMTTQFAVYVSKHDSTEQQLRTLHNKLDTHSEAIAAMKPVVDGVRGLVWKIIFASLGSGGAVAALIATIGK